MNGRRVMRGAATHLVGSVLAVLVFGCAAGLRAAEAVEPVINPPAPSTARLYIAGGGRFEVVAEPGEDGRALARLAEAAWPAWSAPLGLPDHLPIALTVRLIPPERWGGDGAGAGWRVSTDPGGVVTIWIRGGGEPDVVRDRRWLTALAAGVLRRQVILLGTDPTAPVPAWLATGAAEDALIDARPAMLDAWRQATERAEERPTLRTVFSWDGSGDDAEAESARLASYGVWQWLRTEAGRTEAWADMVAAMLRGKSPGLALVEAYPARFARASAAEIELAWSVAQAGLARMRAVPLMEAAESRRWLEQADRVVLRLAGEEQERVVSLAELWAGRADRFIAAEREVRLTRLTRSLSRVHPFYRNAAGSLGRILVSQSEGDRKAWSAALAEWHDDLALGLELEQASAKLLDEAAR